MVPSTPWDGIWHPVASWLGANASQLQRVLPNARNFEQGKQLLTEAQLMRA